MPVRLHPGCPQTAATTAPAGADITQNTTMDETEHRLPDGRISKRATGPSRSQRRREALDVLELAASLMAAPEGLLPKLTMDPGLTELVEESRRVHQQIARKRQTQFLAKHLRKLDDEELDVLRAQLSQDRDQGRRESARLHRLESLREHLIDGGDEALGELLARHPQADRTRLRQLQRQARQERERDVPPRAARELFRLLRELEGDS